MSSTTTTTKPPTSQLWIISKAGGLIYQSAPPSGPTQAFTSVSSNEALILAGTLHGIHAITARLDPTLTPDGRSARGAMETIEADGFSIAIKATVTGVKFLLLHPSTISNQQAQATLQRCYEAYADQVMKNPFYNLEQPVSGFDVAPLLAA